MKHQVAIGVAGLLVAMSVGQLAMAGVSAEEAQKLKTTLTPLGAEKAGNKEGTIPAWDGGYTKVPAGYQTGHARPDPFGSEKPTFLITGKNADQYGDKLAEGVKALLKKYPNFRVDVYPTHRTHSAPQWVYDNTLANATRAKLMNNGLTLEGAYGGVPFPIPTTGNEVMWNHLLRWQGEATEYRFRAYVVSGGSAPVLAAEGVAALDFTYYRKSGSLNDFKGDYFKARVPTFGPPYKAGELFMYRDPVDQANKSRQAWQYLVGQRRVRKAPTFAYDTPDTTTSGTLNVDEHYVFIGPMDRFNWKLVGKQEMFIPYNSNRSYHVKDMDLVTPNHLNPDHVRWELHRVWVVEGTLVPGKRHVVAKKRMYIDEDTWTAVLADGWDGQGQLWKLNFSIPMIAPDLPGQIPSIYGAYNLQTNDYAIAGVTNSFPGQHWKVLQPRPDSFFTADALTTEGSR